MKKGSTWIIILLLIVIFGSIGYVVVNKEDLLNKSCKNKVNSAIKKTEKKYEKIEEETPETKEETNKESENAIVFASSDDKYVLTLISYDRKWLNAKNGNNDYKFILSIDSGMSDDTLYGIYAIDNNVLTLSGLYGCIATTDNSINCELPNNTKTQENNITINYNDKQINLGDIQLLRKN